MRKQARQEEEVKRKVEEGSSAYPAWSRRKWQRRRWWPFARRRPSSGWKRRQRRRTRRTRRGVLHRKVRRMARQRSRLQAAVAMESPARSRRPLTYDQVHKEAKEKEARLRQRWLEKRKKQEAEKETGKSLSEVPKKPVPAADASPQPGSVKKKKKNETPKVHETINAMPVSPRSEASNDSPRNKKTRKKKKKSESPKSSRPSSPIAGGDSLQKESNRARKRRENAERKAAKMKAKKVAAATEKEEEEEEEEEEEAVAAKAAAPAERVAGAEKEATAAAPAAKEDAAAAATKEAAPAAATPRPPKAEEIVQLRTRSPLDSKDLEFEGVTFQFGEFSEDDFGDLTGKLEIAPEPPHKTEAIEVAEEPPAPAVTHEASVHVPSPSSAPSSDVTLQDAKKSPAKKQQQSFDAEAAVQFLLGRKCYWRWAGFCSSWGFLLLLVGPSQCFVSLTFFFLINLFRSRFFFHSTACTPFQSLLSSL